MSEKSAIQWTDSTWNPTRGCTEIAPGCAHCYARTFAERFRGVKGHPYELGFDPRPVPAKLTEPLKWKKPRKVFVDSMSDLFHESFSFEYIAACFGVMAACPQHTFQILTKRPFDAVAFFAWVVAEAAKPDANGVGPNHSDRSCPTCVVRGRATRESGALLHYWNHASLSPHPQPGVSEPWPLPNVWIGTSIANQTDADKNIPHLLQIPAAVRFLSIEPLIGPISGGAFHEALWSRDESVQWVIVGGESGPGARPCNIEWVRSIVEQCKAADVPVFVKQLGASPYATCTFCKGSGTDGGPAMSTPDSYCPRCLGCHRQTVHLTDRKGGDFDDANFPADLRIREFPTPQ